MRPMIKRSYAVRVPANSAEDVFYRALQAHAGGFRGGLKEMVRTSQTVANLWLLTALDARFPCGHKIS